MSIRYKFVKDKNFELNTTKKYKNNGGLKPNGFWYAYGIEWYKFISTDHTNFLKKNPYKYKLNISKKYFTKSLSNIKQNKILVLSTIKEIHNFMNAYKITSKNKKHMFDYIDWNNISNDFAGIEIRNIPRKLVNLTDKKYVWLLSFDAPSGCIWDLKKIPLNMGFKENS